MEGLKGEGGSGTKAGATQSSKVGTYSGDKRADEDAGEGAGVKRTEG